jgi:hypothetical protein
LYKINLYENLRSPQNPKVISIDQYVDYIKNGINETQVLKARCYGKGTKLYDNIKANRFCVTHNFLFDKYKCDENIISSTGLLYYDIDIPVDIDSLDKSKIFIHHKSLGGIGSSIIVKANGITTNNFNESYTSIATELGIENLVDINAIKKTQCTVISYDPSVFNNLDSYVFTATEKLSFSGNISSSFYLPRNDSFFNKKYRNTNASDYVANDKQYEVFPDGILTAKINIPRNIQIGNRTRVLMAITQQMVSINLNSTYEEILNRAIGINQIFTQYPLADNEVESIVQSIIKYRDNQTLNPILNKVRKIIFNKDCKLSKEEKIDVVNKEVGAMRTKKTKQLIYDTIENWNKPEKITGEKIAKEIHKGIATVNRHLKEFKDLINDYNLKLKNENK